VTLLTKKQVRGKVLDHLGLVAATIKDLGLVEKIDALLSLSKNRGSKLTMGQRSAAMILNGLGFMNNRLYMFEKFLENKPVDRLFGKGVEASHFNDDALGRCLDAIAKYGVTKFFTEVSFSIGQEQGLIGPTMRGDTTTLTVYGSYPEEREPQETVRPARGHSKIKRGDLKQMVLHLATTGSAGFPIWMEAHEGNASDKKTLVKAAERMKNFREHLQLDDPIYVGDSAFYSGAVQSSAGMKWLSRVPENIKEAKEVIHTDQENWIDLSNGYLIQSFASEYGGAAQRWVLVYSDQAFKREIKTLERQIEKEEASLNKALWHLGCKEFGCAADAQKALSEIKYKYHKASCEIGEIKKHTSKGRPKEGASYSTVFKVRASLEKDQEKIHYAGEAKGRFILATNDMDRLSDEEILTEYKKQSSTERGFQFIKNNAFEVDSIFLKKPSRIQALMAIMCLCLMIYGFAQHRIRSTLEKANETIPNQLDKETKTPSMQWVYRLFHGVHVLKIETKELSQEPVINLNPLLERIVKMFGTRAMEIYDLVA
jgi:transposase